jgi:mediator of RNA polymerase II transcription subunit 23
VVAMPKALPASILPQFLALEEVIRYIFDRESCLLPGYFVINEILRVYTENRGWPHWVNINYNLIFGIFRVYVTLHFYL